jgi:hypothetical protein
MKTYPVGFHELALSGKWLYITTRLLYGCDSDLPKQSQELVLAFNHVIREKAISHDFKR